MESPYRVVRKALHASLNKKSVVVCGRGMRAWQIITKFLPHDFVMKVARIIK